jgi:hypothetical protein
VAFKQLFPSTSERTPLTEDEERRFKAWVKAQGITDLDHPESFYDYRGYWKEFASKGKDVRQMNTQDQRLHFPDTYKQHGHPTFSQESMYSRGAWDGGKWLGDTLVQPPLPSHRRPARRR